MSVIEINKENFEREVLKSDKPVLVDFNADWCGPCQMLKPIIGEIAQQNSSVKVASVNVDDEEDLAEEFKVYSIPCIVLFKDGVEVKRSVGFKPKEAIESLLQD